ncbi:sigma-54-dependent transcriptional regulator [Halochromatium glycolicum]|jgi:DNA-binding NtrC family response regulator|nr:sigma-54 dependent transcriptional regulator [Halochromatium glycolicum]
MSRVLIADDEPGICSAFAAMLARDGHEALIAANGAEAVTRVTRETLDAVFLDVRMPGMDGLEALARIRDLQPQLPVIVMTAFGTVETALTAVRNGAFDYLGKPLELDQVRAVLERALRAGAADASVSEQAATGEATDDELVGRGPAMQSLFKRIAVLTDTAMTVLILGESGVGKELVARTLHRLGRHREAPFVAVNCAAIPEALLESELFGHARGAFSGAVETRAGRLEAAGAGTLLLDEVGELPPVLQGKLLRVLQERQFEPVGEHRPRALKARVLAATNRDLALEVEAGRFRDDLYHRLNAISLRVPPLRERPEDIPVLAERILARIAADLGRRPLYLEPDALAMLTAHPWPGNVRELQHLLSRSALLARGPSLGATDLLLDNDERSAGGVVDPFSRLEQSVRAALASLLAAPQPPEDPFHRIVRRVERELIDAALQRCNGSQVGASQLLGLHRTTLRKRLQDHD